MFRVYFTRNIVVVFFKILTCLLIPRSFENNILVIIICKKASQRIRVTMRLRNLIPTEAKLHLNKAAILPHLTYCHLVWHFCRASHTRKLERVQERGLCAVFRDKLSRYQQQLVKASLPTLYNRRLQDVYFNV